MVRAFAEVQFARPKSIIYKMDLERCGLQKSSLGYGCIIHIYIGGARAKARERARARARARPKPRPRARQKKKTKTKIQDQHKDHKK
jgi:hypothetical protein